MWRQHNCFGAKKKNVSSSVQGTSEPHHLSYFASLSEGPTIVNVNLYVRSFEKIDDVKMVRSFFVESLVKTSFVVLSGGSFIDWISGHISHMHHNRLFNNEGVGDIKWRFRGEKPCRHWDSNLQPTDLLLLRCSRTFYTDLGLLLIPFSLKRHPADILKNLTLRS